MGWIRIYYGIRICNQIQIRIRIQICIRTGFVTGSGFVKGFGIVTLWLRIRNFITFNFPTVANRALYYCELPESH
jgi:hypothetical protein